VIDPHNFEVGECGGFVAHDRPHRSLMIDWFLDCSPHCIALFVHFVCASVRSCGVTD